ncbi:MAG: D-2-hydroxyacid dehydrogenase [Thermodesulfobacteriota bacterium]
MSDRRIKVLVATPLEEQILQKIRSVNDRLSVERASGLIVAERKGDLSGKAELDRLLAEAEVLYGYIQHFPRDLHQRVSSLRWIQSMTAGIDRLPEAIWNSPIRVTNTRGIHGTSIGEVVLEMMLMFVKDAPACFQMKRDRQWKRFNQRLLRDQTAGIIGLGTIGREIARLCKAFDMTVTGIRRSDGTHCPVPHVDRLYCREQMPELLASSDFVVLALPLTPETRGLIGEKELLQMKPGACLINVARGAIVDEAALVRALEKGSIAGAGLDVFVQEPLPAESPFYNLPNVIFSPHISGYIPDYERRATDLFCENLRRYLGGEPFLHEVDKGKGY